MEDKKIMIPIGGIIMIISGVFLPWYSLMGLIHIGLGAIQFSKSKRIIALTYIVIPITYAFYTLGEELFDCWNDWQRFGWWEIPAYSLGYIIYTVGWAFEFVLIGIITNSRWGSKKDKIFVYALALPFVVLFILIIGALSDSFYFTGTLVIIFLWILACVFTVLWLYDPYSMFGINFDSNTIQQKKKMNINTVDEILKYKQLLDDGTIKQDEFDAKKKQLL